MARVRRFLVVVGVLVLVVVGALTVAAVNTRSTLRDRQAAVDKAWKPLRPALDRRYAALGTLRARVGAASDSSLSSVRELAPALAAWTSSAARSTRVQVADANALESLFARLRAAIAASARLQATAPVTDASNALAATAPAGATVQFYDDAASRYERTRTTTWRRPVADALGFEPVPTLQVAR